jgi:glycosyltransferase involved in cell wall biosynthesis
MSKPLLSVICATYNGALKLPGLLDSLSANLLDKPDLAEIIFVIDGSTDKSEELIGEFQKNHRSTRVIAKKCESNLGISQARNVGLAEARSEVIAFLDDDCRPSQSWIEDVISLWGTASQKIVGIGGVVSSYKPVTFNQRYCGAVTPLRPYPLKVGRSTIPSRLRYYYTKAPDIYSHAEYLVGCCMTFRKYSLDRVHGFDPLMKFGGDDHYICEKLRSEYGEKVLVIDPRLVMPHEFSRQFTDSLRRSYSYGVSNGRDVRRNIKNLSFNPGPFVTLLYFLILYLVLGMNIPFISGITRLAFSVVSATIGYISLLFWRKIILEKFVPAKLMFGISFLLCESINIYGMLSGFVRTSKN